MHKCFSLDHVTREMDWKATAANLARECGADKVHIAVNMKSYSFAKYYGCDNIMHVLNQSEICAAFMNEHVKQCIRQSKTTTTDDGEAYYPLYQLDDNFLGILYVKNSKRTIEDWLLGMLAMAIKYDMSRRKINQTTKSIEEIRASAVQEVKKMSAMRDTFIATMSHELRTPLTGLIGANQILLQTNNSSASETTHKMLKVQQECASQLAELINDILDFCKLRSTSVSLQNDAFSLHDVVQKCAAIYEAECEKKDIKLVCDVSPDVQKLQFLGDARRVKQIVLNLLNNSVKYTQKGSIHVRVYIENILCIRVEDTGSGISEENLKYIFEPYFTAKQENWTQVRNGVGLGLAICYELVSLMKGTIGATSDGHSGTTITVTLPLKDINYQKQVLENNVLLRDLSVLILEDRMEQRMYLIRLLAQHGIRTQAFATSTEALMAVEVMQRDLQLALVDIDLSESGEKNDSGIIFAQSVRTRRLSMPLIALSSVGEHFGGEFLFDRVLVKPINESDLFLCMQECLERRKLLRTDSIEQYFEHHQPTTECNNATNKIRKNSSISDMVLTESEIRRSSNSGGGASKIYSKSLASAHELEESQHESLSFLIVDDDQTNAKIFAEMLVQLGYAQHNVYVVASGSECLTFLSETKTVDIIYLDIVMPKMSGYECAKRIRAVPDRYGGKQVRIVALTADALDSTRSKCLSQGFDYFLPKPITLDDLRTSITWMTSKK